MSVFATQAKQGSHGLPSDFAFAHTVGNRGRRRRRYRVRERRSFFEKRNLLGELDHASLLHGRVAVLDREFWELRGEGLGEDGVGLVQPELGLRQAVFLDDRTEDLPHQPLDQRPLLDDRNGMGLLDPGHRPVDPVAFSA